MAQPALQPRSGAWGRRFSGIWAQLARHPWWWILALALAVRVAGLGYHSYWFDEAMSGYWSSRPAAEIWRVGLGLVVDKHPPLYYLLLRGWTALFGPGDLAGRSLGSILGALAVLPTYGLGDLLGGRRTAIFSALLLAINPFLVWYSQEVRMFMPATTFALAGLYGLLALSRADFGRHRLIVVHWLMAVLGLTAALYSYLYSAFLLPVAGLWVLLSAQSRRRRPGARTIFGLGLAALVVVALLFLPLAWSAWRVSGAEAEPGRAFAGMAGPLRDLLQVYTLGWPSWDAALLRVLTAVLGALVALGLVVPLREHGDTARLGGAYLAIWIVGLILVGGYLLSRDSRVFGEARYQIVVVPALCLALGRFLGWAWERRRPVGWAVTVCALAVTVAALRFDWAPENRREAWRETAAFVTLHAGPRDAIVIQADYLHLAFERYYAGGLPVFYPFTERLTDPAAVDPPLNGLADYDAVWLIQSHHEELDPNGLVVGWFGARFPLITEAFPAGIAVRAFDQRYRVAELPGELAARSADLSGAAARLVNCRYEPAVTPPTDDLFHPPSAWIHVTTYWAPETTAATLPAGAERPVIRLVDGDGQVWGESLARSNDAFGVWPRGRWLPEEFVRAHFDVNLNPITPPGDYRLVVESLGDGTRTVECGTVVVVR